MTKPSNEFIFKIVVFGDSEVGKTNLIEKHVSKGFKFSKQYKQTIGSDFFNKDSKLGAIKITQQIWDSPGEGKTEIKKAETLPLSISFYKGADGFILAFDITEKNSLINAEEFWLTQAVKINKDLPILLVGCKYDLKEKRQVTREEAEACAKRMGVAYVETSAKEGINIDLAFESLTKKMYERATTNKSASENAEKIKNIDYKSAIADLEKECESYRGYLQKQLDSLIETEKKNNNKQGYAVVAFESIESKNLFNIEAGEKIVSDLNSYKETTSKKLPQNKSQILDTAEKMLAATKLIGTLSTGNDETKFNQFKDLFKKEEIQKPLNANPDSRGIKFLRILAGILTLMYVARRRSKEVGTEWHSWWQSRTDVFLGKSNKKINEITIKETGTINRRGR